MADGDEFNEDDLFADIYDNDEAQAAEAPAPVPAATPAIKTEVAPPVPHAEAPSAPIVSGNMAYGSTNQQIKADPDNEDNDVDVGNSYGQGNDYNQSGGGGENYPPIGIKEDGKMFIGGLNWETTEDSLKDYFSQFGEVTECTVMRDSATGRSRGFGFLTFRDPKCVNTVMVKEHYLDGKIIDPKRAIPREEQERTSKIFVGGVSQECTEHDFKTFFMQFGRVVDATLMIDKDTGRPRGFGFVTFDGDSAVDATLSRPLEIHGKMIEVKRAQPRGNLQQEDSGKGFGRGRFDKFNNRGNDNYANGGDNQQNQNGPSDQGGAQNGMTPAMMAAYWQRMQQYFQMMQQQMAGGMGGGMNNMGPMSQMNPAMMQQMMMMQGGNQGPGTPNPQAQGGMNQMNPAMMQQMQQMQQMQMQQQQSGQGGPSGSFSPSPDGPQGQRPAFNAQEQLAFEQQKYEQQQHRRMQYSNGGNFAQGGPTSWEGMYEDVPQPNVPSGPQGQRGGFRGGRGGGGGGSQGTPQGARGGSATPSAAPAAPAGAPTGPKNAGRPGANYRGGGRGGHRGFHPYAR